MTGSISITNSIFYNIQGTLSFFAPKPTFDYCYLAGFTTPPTGTNVTNTFDALTLPSFTDAPNLDFKLSNSSSFVGSDAFTVGNTRYYLTQLDVPVLGLASSINTSGFTANWTTVVNATAYRVKVYQGTTWIATFVAEGQSTESKIITGLDNDTEYTYTVQALGDGDIYFADSYVSSSSVSVTTGPATGGKDLSINTKIYNKDKSVFSTTIGNIIIYSLQGTELLQANNTNHISTNLSAGLYLVKFESGDGIENIHKILIH
jgi:hypothetical protein